PMGIVAHEGIAYEPEVGLAPFYLNRMRMEGRAAVHVVRCLVTEIDAPIVIHCVGGKDRTRMLVALTLALLEVPDEVIVDDYASSEQRLPPLSSPEYAAMVSDLEERGLPVELIHARAHTMERFLAGVRAEWGSIEGAAHAFGMSGAEVD